MSRAGHACNPACPDRAAAMARGEFCYHFALRGWVRIDVPERRPGTLVLMRYAFGKIDELPLRKPYTFETCIWCGGDLDAPDTGEGEE